MTPINGFLIFYSGPMSTDLEGEYFTAKSDLDLAGRQELSLYFEHGRDPSVGKRRIGVAKLARKSTGLWATTRPVAELPPKIWQGLVDLSSEGLLGFSSGAASHLAEVAPDGWIKSWPLIDASLTVSPAEPRCIAAPNANFVKRVELNDTVTKLRADYVRHLQVINEVRLWQYA